MTGSRRYERIWYHRNYEGMVHGFADVFGVVDTTTNPSSTVASDYGAFAAE